MQNYADVLESMKIPAMEKLNCASAQELIDIRFKVYLPYKTMNQTFKGTNLNSKYPNCIYFDKLMQFVISQKYSEKEFIELIEFIGKPINVSDPYFSNKLDTDKLGLIYLGTHQNVECIVFYSKTKHGFVVFYEDTKASQITDNDIIPFKVVINAFKKL